MALCHALRAASKSAIAAAMLLPTPLSVQVGNIVTITVVNDRGLSLPIEGVSVAANDFFPSVVTSGGEAQSDLHWPQTHIH